MRVIHMAFTEEQWEEMAKFFDACCVPLTVKVAEEAFPKIIVEGLQKALAEMQADDSKAKEK